MDTEALKAKLGDDAPALQAALDASAASARKAEKAKADQLAARVAELEALAENAANAGKSEAEKLKLEYDKATKRAKELEERAAKAESEFRNHRRGNAIERHLGSLALLPGLDRSLIKPAFAGLFNDVADDELEDAEKVKPIIEAFKAKSKAILVDTSGHGSGDSTRPRGVLPTSDDPSKQSDADRLKALRGIN